MLVAQVMLHVRGLNRDLLSQVHQYIHKQRIECLWCDLFTCVTSLLLYFLESVDALDSHCEIDLYALHYVYVPRINQQIETFQNAWNKDRMRTSGGCLPLQMFAMNANFNKY